MAPIRRADGKAPVEADVRSHLWKINAEEGAEQFYDDEGETYSNPWITPEYACLNCHADESPAWAREFSPDMHVLLPSGSYVGSFLCEVCHFETQTGHSFALNEVLEAEAPDYPWSEVPDPPTGQTWEDILYVIGGFGWKARFIGQDGYLITGSEVQYNLASQSWAAWADGETRPFDCGACHTTAYDPDAPSHRGLPGMVGDWLEAGVGCEACHGPGADHVSDPQHEKIESNPLSTVCGGCHTREAENKILELDGFIASRSQYDEFAASDHSSTLECSSCHASHLSTRYDAENAIKIVCGDCHTGKGLRRSATHPPAPSSKVSV